MRRLGFVVLVVSVSVAGLTRAQSPPLDALECFKASSHVPVSLDASLAAAHPDLSSIGSCMVRGAVRSVCTPVARTPSASDPGPDIANDFTCYKMRCPSTPRPADRGVSDQLGEDVPTSHYKLELLCVPGRIGDTTTSTSTSTTTSLPPQCGQLSQQCSEGTASCGPGLQCGSVSPGSCGCLPLPPACGDAPRDQCGAGVCPTGQTCTSFNGNVFCGCIETPLVPCGDPSAPAPQCDGVCPGSYICTTFPGQGCFCYGTIGPCGQSVLGNAPPECNGDCPDPAAPYCRDVGGTCACTP